MQNGLSTKMRHLFVLVAAISLVAFFFQNCGEEFDNSDYVTGSSTLPGDEDIDEGGDETIPPPPDDPDPIGDLPVFFQNVVATGNEHACGLTTTDTVACWGRNNGGKLGNNATTASSLPVTAVNLAGAKAVSIGANHSCAITAQDKVMC